MHYRTFMVLFGAVNHHPGFLNKYAIDHLLSPSPSEGLYPGDHHGYITYSFCQSLQFQRRYRTWTETRMEGEKQIPL